MKLVVNGTSREMGDAVNVASLIQALGLLREQVAVERNGELIPRREHAEVQLSEGDVLEIVTLVGGG